MSHAMYFITGVLFTFIVCVSMIVRMSRYVEAMERKVTEHETNLVKSKWYIWVNVDDRLPTRADDYVVEYYYGDAVDWKYYSVHRFDPRENRFECEGFKDLKHIRWAELPK